MLSAMGGPCGGGPQNALLNQGQDNEMELFGYKTPTARKALCIVGYVLTLGFLLLLFYWKPEWDVWAQCTPCSLEEADTILLRATDEFKQCCKKKIFWIYLSSLNSKFSNVIMADEDSIINRAIMKPELKVRCIRVQKIKYVWLASEKCFVTVGALENKYSCSDIHEKFGSGLTQDERDMRSLVCGNNVIEVEIVPIWKLLFKEVLNPFNFFQIASLALWLEEGYTEYAIAIIVMTILSIIFTVYDLRQQSVKLHNLVESNNNVMVTALRKNGDCTTLESRHLVPGDIIVLTGKKLFLPCDTILLTGSCIVNEGMLTGESIPVTKTPLPDVDNGIPWKVHSGEDYKRHILFCGTEVIQTKPPRNGPATALVLQTGFCTAKGDMVRSILYPKPMNFKLYRDAFRFIMCLVAIAVVGMIYTVIVIKRQTDDVREIVVKALLIITVAIPPALPGALGVTMMYAQKRLKNKGIFCISPQRINICGRLNIVCFDKVLPLAADEALQGAEKEALCEDLANFFTTKVESIRDGICEEREPQDTECTQEGLASLLAGGMGQRLGEKIDPQKCICRICGVAFAFQDVYKFNAGHVMPWGPMVGAMASCHSLIIVDGKLQGDPLDMKMFEGTDWEIDASNMIHSNDDSATSENNVVRPGPRAVKAPCEGITILHQLPFSSSLQRMCVIAHLIGQETCVVYMKGAPEKVVSFCRPETVPANFTRELQLYTLQGFRVIGLAQKPIELTTNEDLGNIKREVIEEDLEFLGLLVMENRLKKETRAVLQELNTANIRTVMITGDNLQTAITVAKNSGLVSPSNRIIKVEAAEPRDAASASITWQLMEDYTKTDLILSETQADQVGHYNPEYGNYNFALSGKSYEVIVQYFYDLLPKILMNGAIFARMSPGQKSNLIEEFQKLDYYVGMCGDGANDCGALKVAHAGISLSEQEASVASPFTSKTTNIECVPSLIREGRTALVGTFCVFKYMTLYAMIQFICMLLLYWQVKILLIYHYLLQDVGVTVAACLTMSLTCPYPKLAPYRPPAQLISPPLLLSVILNILYSLALQICGYAILQQQPWYNSIDHITCAPLNLTNNETTTIVGPEDDPASSETTTLWALTTINCIIVAFVFAKGRPFRKPIYTNYVFFILLILQLGVMIFILFADFEGIYRRLEFVCTPVLWRVYVLVMLGILFIISFTTEEAVIENRKLWLLLKKTLNYYSKSQYRRLLRILPKESNWPPLDQTDYADKIMVPTGYEEKVFVNAAYENEAGLTDRNHETRVPEQSPNTDVS